MSLLDPTVWSGKAGIGGWTATTGGGAPVVEPATGEVLELIGVAAPDDVAVAADRAAKAQPAWARTPYLGRAAVLRRAGDLFTGHAEEIQQWLIREAGSIPGKAAFETSIAAQECWSSIRVCG